MRKISLYNKQLRAALIPDRNLSELTCMRELWTRGTLEQCPSSAQVEMIFSKPQVAR